MRAGLRRDKKDKHNPALLDDARSVRQKQRCVDFTTLCRASSPLSLLTWPTSPIRSGSDLLSGLLSHLDWQQNEHVVIMWVKYSSVM